MTTRINSIPCPETIDFDAVPGPVMDAVGLYAVLDVEQMRDISIKRGVLAYSFPDEWTYAVPTEVCEGANSTYVEHVAVDFNTGENKVKGVGALAYVFTEKCVRPPYVEWTETIEGKRQGRGIRRMRTMNDLVLRQFGLPLHSDPVGETSEEAKGVWLKLVESGEAEVFEDNGFYRYRFTSIG